MGFEDGDEDEGDESGAIVYTYGKGEESKTKQHSCITDKREDPHVVMSNVSMKALKLGRAERRQLAPLF